MLLLLFLLFNLRNLVRVLQETNHDVPLLILTDGVEDPHNMGAIIRTAECVGLRPYSFLKRHNAPINATVAKTSAGAIEQIPLVQVGNVAQTIKQLQKQGFGLWGLIWKVIVPLYEADMTIPTVIVIGNEGKGISRVVKEGLVISCYHPYVWEFKFFECICCSRRSYV